jgi:hypothetical protein
MGYNLAEGENKSEGEQKKMLQGKKKTAPPEVLILPLGHLHL